MQNSKSNQFGNIIVAKLVTPTYIHVVNKFSTELRRLVDTKPFDGSPGALAAHAGLDRVHIHRLLKGDRSVTSEMVSRLIGTLPAASAARLLEAHLQDIVSLSSTASDKFKQQPLVRWRSPKNALKVTIRCEADE